MVIFGSSDYIKYLVPQWFLPANVPDVEFVSSMFQSLYIEAKSWRYRVYRFSIETLKNRSFTRIVKTPVSGAKETLFLGIFN